MGSQLFWNGNKRLTEFYNINDYSKIDGFIYDNCNCIGLALRI